MTETTTPDVQQEMPVIAAFRLVDGQVVIGQLPRMPNASEDAGLMDYTVKNPVIYAIVQKPGILAGEPPKPVPAMQKYRVLPGIGDFATELFLQYTQILGSPAEITISELVDLYHKTISRKSAQ